MGSGKGRSVHTAQTAVVIIKCLIRYPSGFLDGMMFPLCFYLGWSLKYQTLIPLKLLFLLCGFCSIPLVWARITGFVFLCRQSVIPACVLCMLLFFLGLKLVLCAVLIDFVLSNTRVELYPIFFFIVSFSSLFSIVWRFGLGGWMDGWWCFGWKKQARRPFLCLLKCDWCKYGDVGLAVGCLGRFFVWWMDGVFV